ncbi:uncharacterized protein LOC133531314 [Cydia pomonella]|uniref:uncharacterized protein LOC133531314 n=1 Tax=Cydia pomonella TaxID=82600 RepID=UPI002ADE2B49|nr:uncharacterized protein LOC133531314 [Cydia pomonella]
MVPRIFREGICCSPSKFRRPKFNVIYSIERSTSSNQPPDGVDMCKKYQRTIDYTLGSHHYDDPNKLRPTVYIAHTTVFDTNKDGEKNTETLLESLQRKLAWQQRIRQNLSVDEAQKNEASADEVAAEADKKGDHFATDGSLQTDNVWRYATMYDSDVTKDDKLVQKPEPFHEIDENRVFVDPPSLRPAHNRYRYEMDSEAQAYDELAKKYLTMERDQVDKRLLQDMERLGLPIDTSEATSPPININVSCEKEGVHEVVAPKHAESQQREATINNNPQYYDQISWCNLYFQNEHLSEIPSSEEGVPENDKGFGPNAFHYDMLPLHCYLDFDPFDESNEINKSIEKLGFEEHDDILPFHLLQCQDFIQLDLKVSNDNNKVNSPLESINVDDIQPNHFALQGNLMNEVASTSNAIEALEQYDFNRSLEELYVGHTEPVADVFHSLMYDMDVTKFDYTFPRDNINVEFSLNNQHENHKFQTVKDTPQESGTIIQIEDQTMPKKELKKEKEDKLKLLSHVNLAKPKVAQQQINLSQKVHKATNDNKSDTIVQANLNLVKPKVAEQQINLSQKVQNATNDKKSDTIVLANPEPNLAKPKVAEQQINLFQKVQKATNNKTSDTIVIANPEPNLAKPKVAEQQINLSQKVEKATNDKQSGTIVQANPELNPKTEVELRDFINAKVMEQVRAYTPSENTTRPHERLDNLVQVNPESLPNHELKPHVNFAKPNVAEQLMDVLQNVKKATNNNKSDTVVQPHPVPSPKTEAELRNFINAKVMEQVGAHTASDTRTKPRERFDRLVQMNPPSPQHNDVTNIIHARILEQVRAPPPSLKLTTNSVKGIDSIIQMQPQAAFEIKPEKVAHKEPLTETKLMNDNATCQTTPTLEKAQITTKPTEEQNSEQPNTNTAVKAEETKKNVWRNWHYSTKLRADRN